MAALLVLAGLIPALLAAPAATQPVLSRAVDSPPPPPKTAEPARPRGAHAAPAVSDFRGAEDPPDFAEELPSSSGGQPGPPSRGPEAAAGGLPAPIIDASREAEDMLDLAEDLLRDSSGQPEAAAGAGRALAGGAVDAGGDSCAWYGSRPHLCGCCDGGGFRASSCHECAAAAGQTPPCTVDRMSALRDELDRFPNKTTAIRRRASCLNGTIPDDLPSRFPKLSDLDLSSNHLEGEIPTSLWRLPLLRVLRMHSNNLQGQLTEAVGAASELALIDLSKNELSGPLPKAVASWTKLQVLGLYSNSLSGAIPEEVGAWQRLWLIYVHGNSFNGSIPRAVGNWSWAEDVRMSSNSLSGPIPEEVGTWRALKTLHLHDNHLSGPIPTSVANWSRVTKVSLGPNDLSGPIPEEVGGWRQVKEVYLHSNRLSGPIPPGVADWSQVTKVVMSSNELSGHIPEEVGAWRKLQQVYLDGNRLSGRIPRAVRNWRQVLLVSLSDNALSGTIPMEVAYWQQLRQLSMSRNRLSGSIPRWAGYWQRVQYIGLSENRLSGALPQEVGFWRQLQKLYLRGNSISGSLPRTVASWSQVIHVSMGGNDLCEDLPQEVGAWRQLQRLYLDGNRISGPIPESVANWSRVQVVDLHNNNFTGPIPDAVGAWQQVQFVGLNKNRLSGPIPHTVAGWSQAEEVRLGDNPLFCEIPEEVGGWRRLKKVWLQHANLSGRIPSSVASWSDITIATLEGNSLIGPIPEEVGAWRRVQQISLKGNLLTGQIPAAVANWSEATFVNLRDNWLEGQIPEAVGAWRQVEKVWLSDNRLTGSIPSAVAGWTQVQLVYFDGNALAGAIPAAVGAWRQLREVSLAKNHLSGPIPDEVGAWRQVQAVELKETMLSGPIPDAVGNWSKVTSVNFYSCRLHGKIPPEVGAWQQVKSVFLNSNRLTGEIPAAVGKWSQVVQVMLDSNFLSGPLPEEVGAWRELREFMLHDTNISGSLPRSVANWSQLRIAGLGSCAFSGTIPEEVGAWTQVEKVFLQGNHFVGSIPPAVANWSKAWYVSLGSNSLSGPIPPEVGAWKQVKEVRLRHNQLSGKIPPAVANWSRLRTLTLNNNFFSGDLPEEVGAWQDLLTLTAQENRFSGPIPKAVGAWQRLQRLSLGSNNFEGPIPAVAARWGDIRFLDLSSNRLNGSVSTPLLRSWPWLQHLDLSCNRLRRVGTELYDNQPGWGPPVTSIPAEGGRGSAAAAPAASTTTLLPQLRRLNISHNNLTELSEALYSLPRLQVLELQANRISRWPLRGVLPVAAWVDGRAKGMKCGWHPVEQRFGWARLQRLDASGNPLGDTHDSTGEVGDPLRVFLHSVAYLTELSEIICSGCGLWGSLPAPILGGLVDNVKHTGTKDCVDVPARAEGLDSLRVLDLSNNGITAIYGRPVPSLVLVDLSANGLQYLHRDWFNQAQVALMAQLRLSGNPGLRAEVAPPTSYCPANGATTLTADPLQYVKTVDRGYECTGLCHGTTTQYAVDSELSLGSLCRCLPGHRGRARDCEGCPADTYSAEAAALGLVRECRHCEGLVRECRPCPEFARSEPNASAVSQCRCPAGRYLAVEAAHVGFGGASGGERETQFVCRRCHQWPFRTTERMGERSDTTCRCNATYHGLKAIAQTCGCEDGHYMNHVTLRCERCGQSEKCQWGAEIEKSLVPPTVKAGFWAEPVPDTALFAKNEVWRCVSAASCGEGGRCAEGRAGHACSLCEPGRFGGPDGACASCPSEPEVQQVLMAAVVLKLVPVPVLLHILLAAKSNDRGFMLSFRAFRRSLKQMIRQLQTISIIGGFSVDWPPLAKSFFEALGRFTVYLPSLAGAACLQEQTSVPLEMGFKWGMPLGFALSTLLAMPVSWVVARLARRCLSCPRIAKWMPVGPDAMAMGLWDVLRVLLLAGMLFYSTLLANSLEIITCVPSPNGVWTVKTYPHLECRASSEFLVLALPSVLTLAAYVGSIAVAVFWGYKRTRHCMAATNLEDRGWFGFLFDDFRDDHCSWTLKLLAKDVAFALIPVLFIGQGAVQLLLSAALAAFLVLRVRRDSPYQDMSNTLLETWNGGSAAALCIYSVGMGYEQTPGVEDIEVLFQDGDQDRIYKARAIGMVVVQVLAVMVPVTILVYQLCCAVPCLVRRMPACVRPLKPEERAEWSKGFANSMSRYNLYTILDQFDVVDFHSFRTLFEQSTAIAGRRLSDHSVSSLVRMVKIASDATVLGAGQQLEVPQEDEDPESNSHGSKGVDDASLEGESNAEGLESAVEVASAAEGGPERVVCSL